MDRDDKRYTAICPVEGCLSLVNGAVNWKKGNICILGVCSGCGKDYLEEDLDWKEDLTGIVKGTERE